MKKLYFSYARTAFKFGLLSLNIEKDSEILIPSYICDVMIAPIKNLKLKHKYYEIDYSFQPSWNKLQNLITKKTKAIVMVNYFGNIIEIDKYISFAKSNNLFLIEDNAHGFGGKLNNKELGTYGDIGISSPRKLLNMDYGGVLYLNNNLTKNFDIHLNKYNSYSFIKNTILNFKKLIKKIIFYNNFKKFVLNRPEYENQNSFREDNVIDYFLDSKSKKNILKININIIKKKRRENYYLWEKFCLENNLTPIFKSIGNDVVPWCFPAYVANHDQAIKWFNFGWKNNVHIFSWPTLPTDIDQENSFEINKWKKIVCFNTESFL